MKNAQTHLVVVGAGGHGSEVTAYARELSKTHLLSLMGVIDDHKEVGHWNGTSVIGNLESLRALSLKMGDVRYITALGDNATRKAMVERLIALSAKLEPYTLIHGTASVGQQCKIGQGTLLAPFTILTTNVTVGNHCILNVKVSLSHDVVVEDFVNLNPGCTITGNCHLEEGCYIGAGATILPGVRVGRWAVVGGGALVREDVPANTTVVGVPAREIKKVGKPKLAVAQSRGKK